MRFAPCAVAGFALLACSSSDAPAHGGADAAFDVLASPDAADASAPYVFDYYISPTGNDANPGTLAQPWAITALNTKQSVYSGKIVGLLDGKYEIASMMTTDRDVPALRINGGTASAQTVIAAAHPRAAIIDANDGQFSGGSNTNAMLGHKSSAPQEGYITIDGLELTGGSYQVIEIGNYDFSGPVVPGVIIQNCEFTASDASHNPSAVGGNGAQISLYKNSGTVLRNNYHHDNYGMGGPGSGDHFSALYQWESSGTTIEYVTLVNSGNLHGKEGGNQGTTIRYSYIDVTSYTTGQNRAGIEGFDGATTAGLTQPSAFHHNVIVYADGAVDLQSELGSGGWSTPVAVYNNTFVASGGWSYGLDYYEAPTSSKLLSFYNNLYFDDGQVATSYGYVLSNVDAFALADYNVYGTHAKWNTVPAGASTSANVTPHGSLADWQGAIGGDAHSQMATIVFANNGARALRYQISGGVASGEGHVGGLATGVAVNAGAWDGTSARIGTDF